MKFILIVFIFIFNVSWGQNPIIKSCFFYPQIQTLHDIVYTADDCVIICCNSADTLWTVPNCDALFNFSSSIVKIDSSGKILWKRCLPFAGGGEVYLKNIIPSPDSTFYIVYAKTATNQGYIEKYNKDGNITFTKQLTSSGMLYNNLPASNPVLHNNNIYILTSNLSYTSFEKYYLQKYSLTGNLVSQVLIPQIINLPNGLKNSSKLDISPSGKILLVTHIKQPNTDYGLDVLIMSFNNNFDLINTKTINRYPSDIPLSSLFVTESEVFVSITDRNDFSKHFLLSYPNLDSLKESKQYILDTYFGKTYFLKMAAKDWDNNIILNEDSRFFKLNSNDFTETLSSNINESGEVFSTTNITKVLPIKNKGYIGIGNSNFIDGFYKDPNKYDPFILLRYGKENECLDNFVIANNYKNNYNVNAIKLTATSNHPKNRVTNLFAEKSVLLLPGFQAGKSMSAGSNQGQLKKKSK